MPNTNKVALECGKTIMQIFNGFREANLTWNIKNSEKINDFKIQKKERDVKFEAKFEILKSNLDKDVAFVKDYNKKTIKDYNDFLDSFDDLILKLEQSYPQLQKPLILIIHRYASDLLNSFYSPNNNKNLLKNYGKILDLLIEMAYDTNDLTEGSSAQLLFPERTIKFIRSDNKS